MHFDQDEEDPFVVYRPPVTSGRLDPVYTKPQRDTWRPSVSYKHSLRDIEQQFTPSEFFRHRLRTVGKEIRLLQKLETRWTHKFAEFTRASIRVQARFRGMLGRMYMQTIRDELERDLRRRRSYQNARNSFLEGLFDQSLQFCLTAEQHPEELLVIQMNAQYRLAMYSDCAQSAERIIALNRLNEDAYYMYACSCGRLQQFEAAVDKLRVINVLKARCSVNLYRLFAGLVVKLDPPDFSAAADSLSQIIDENRKDFDALLQRAFCFCCLQEWTDAMKDVSVILAFRPIDLPALLLRGRIHAARREWEEARLNYEFVQLHYPGNAVASQRLVEIAPFNEIVMPLHD